MHALRRRKSAKQGARRTKRYRTAHRRAVVETLERRLMLYGPGDFVLADLGAEQVSICSSVATLDCSVLDEFGGIAAVDFQDDGNVVVAGNGNSPAEVRIYDSSNQNVGSFISEDFGGAVDFDAAKGRFYVGTGRAGGVVELDADGNRLRTFGEAAYEGVAVVGDQLWAGLDRIDRFDLATGELVDSIPLLQDLTPVGRLFKSKPTKSVLTIAGGQIVEIDTTTFEISRIIPVPTGTSLLGITRGPENRIVATGYGSAGLIFQWNEDGSFFGARTVPPPAIPFGIGWVGNTVADLSVDLATNVANPVIGERIDFTITVRNDGPASASGVTIQSPRAAGLQPFQDPVASQGTFDPLTGTWQVGDVDQSAELRFTTSLDDDASGEIEQTAELASADQLDSDSQPGNGELAEDDMDEVIFTVAPDTNLDWGDAQGTGFPTRRAQDGARHDPEGATLGSLRDTEDDGRPSAGADGDDAVSPANPPSDDEDGLAAHLISPTCGTLLVDVKGITAQPYYLNAWIDFDGNSAWGEDGEQVAVDFEIVLNGTQVVPVFAPPAAVVGTSVVRLRLSTEKGLGVGGQAPNGEVEDHLVEIRPAPTVVYVDDDFAGLELGTDPDGDGPATALGYDAMATIQAGVDCVATGGTVAVSDGSYQESVSIPKTVKVVGAGENTVVTAAAGGDGFTIAANSVEIASLMVTGSRRGVSATGVSSPKLSNVLSVKNTDDGFYGADLTGTVHISGGSFSENEQLGIELNNVEVVRLEDGVNANENTIGVFVRKAQLFFDSAGVVNQNDDDGIRLLDIKGNVTLLGTEMASNDSDSDNSGDGLFAGVSSDGNGVAIGGDVLIKNAVFGGVAQSSGAFIASVAGHVEVNSVTANDHQIAGLRIESFASTTLVDNKFSRNDTGIALSGNTTSPISIINTESNENHTSNLVIQGASSVQIERGAYNSANSEFRGFGIQISDVGGPVEIKQATASNNRLHQLQVENARTLLVEGGSFNGSLVRSAILIRTVSESVELRGVTADNRRTGADIYSAKSVAIVDGQFTATLGIGADIHDAETVVVKGSTFESDSSNGLSVDASSVVLENVSVDGGSEAGVSVVIDDGESVQVSGGSFGNVDGPGLVVNVAGKPIPVNVTSATFNNNEDGIQLTGAGTVTLTNINADGNRRHGINIIRGQDITVSGGSASGNKVDGVNLSTVGNVTVSNLQANNNTAGNGIFVLNAGDVTVLDGSISGNGTQATGNRAHGLTAKNVKDVTTRNVKGLSNDPAVFVSGASSYRDFDSDFSNNTDGGVTLEGIRGDVLFSGTIVNNNDTNGDGIGAGIQVSDIGGTVRIDGVTATQNADGVRVDGPVAVGIRASELAENNVGLRNHGGFVATENSQIRDNTQQDTVVDQGGTVDQAAAVSGFVYRDLDDDGLRADAEPGLPNVPVRLVDAASGRVRIVSTGADGSYLFDLLPPSRYSIIVTSPLVYAAGINSPGTDDLGNPLTVTTGVDRFEGLDLAAGTTAVNFNFGVGPFRDELFATIDPLPGGAIGSDHLARLTVDGPRAYRYQPNDHRLFVTGGGLSWQLYTAEFVPVQMNVDRAPLSTTIVKDQEYLVTVAAFGPDTKTRIRITPAPLSLTNPVNRLDVDGDGQVTPLDALVGVNDLNTRGSRRLGNDETTTYYLDVSGDGLASPIDVLIIVNDLNAPPPAGEAVNWLGVVPVRARAQEQPFARVNVPPTHRNESAPPPDWKLDDRWPARTRDHEIRDRVFEEIAGSD